jgi:hypothetical protein
MTSQQLNKWLVKQPQIIKCIHHKYQVTRNLMSILHCLVENINIKFKLFLLLQLLYFSEGASCYHILWAEKCDVLGLEPIIVQSGPKSKSTAAHTDSITAFLFTTDCNLIIKPNWVLKHYWKSEMLGLNFLIIPHHVLKRVP